MICSETFLSTLGTSSMWALSGDLQGLLCRGFTDTMPKHCGSVLQMVGGSPFLQSSNRAHPLNFNTQLWVFTYRRGAPRFVPRWWSSTPQEIILRMEAPGRGKGNWGAGICFMWFNTAGEEIKVWNYTKNTRSDSTVPISPLWKTWPLMWLVRYTILCMIKTFSLTRQRSPFDPGWSRTLL